MRRNVLLTVVLLMTLIALMALAGTIDTAPSTHLPN